MSKVMGKEELFELRECGENLSPIDSHLALLDWEEEARCFSVGMSGSCGPNCPVYGCSENCPYFDEEGEDEDD